MQNKHQFFFFSFGRPNFGGGGGSTWLGQIPKFFQKLDLKAPLTAFGASTPLMHPPLRCIHYLASSSTKPSTAVGYYAHCAFPLSLIAEGRLHGIRPLRPTFLLLWALAAFCMELLACSPCPPWAPLVVYHLKEKDTPHELIHSSLIQARVKLSPLLLV